MASEIPSPPISTALVAVPTTTTDSRAIAVLAGRPLHVNRGTSLNLDWIESVRVNTSAVERRAATLVTRRTVKKDWQIAWLLRAITCMDLTTLSGDDTDERVRRLCAKARQPLQNELIEKLGIAELQHSGRRRLRLPPVCRDARSALSKAAAFRSPQSPPDFPPDFRRLHERIAEIRTIGRSRRTGN